MHALADALFDIGVPIVSGLEDLGLVFISSKAAEVYRVHVPCNFVVIKTVDFARGFRRDNGDVLGAVKKGEC